ncbi:hypothetical protein EMCRGX_G032034 [Ephydatia muelleri]|eukprot:Em0019g779a
MSSNPIYKVVLVGDPGVGKTSILQRLLTNTFSDTDAAKGTAAAAIDSKIHTIDLGNDKKVDFHIWDTAGQERFSTLTAGYYRDANGSIVVFDVTNLESFSDVGHWIEDTDRYASVEISKILVGNKSDLQSQRAVKFERGKSTADSNFIPYIESSAKEGTNIQEIFTTLARELVKKEVKQSNQHDSSVIKISPTKKDTGKKRKCVV